MERDGPEWKRKELKIRITESLYDRLVEECGRCGCTINAVVSMAIGREVGLRKRQRVEQAQKAIEARRIELEARLDAN